MFVRDSDMPEPGAELDARSLVRKQLASLRLVEPLILATLYRPGLGEDVSGDELVKAQSTLLFRTLELTDRIIDRLRDTPAKSAFERYQVACEVVGLIAMQWRTGSDLTADDLACLAEHAVEGGLQLMQGLNDEPYRPGDEASERLSSAIRASTKIMLAMQSRATLGHDVPALAREMTAHLAETVTIQAARMRQQNNTPTIQALIRVCSDYYPALWDSEIAEATRLFSSLSGDPEKFRAEAERLRRWPLNNYFARVEQALDLCIEMAGVMQQLLDERVEPNAQSSRLAP